MAPKSNPKVKVSDTAPAELTNPEHEKLLEVLKFTPRTYKIQVWGYGDEIVMGSVDKKVWDYFRDHRINLSDYAWDSSYGEELNIPEDCRPFYPGEWHDCDDMYHGWGVSKSAGTLCILDENDEEVYKRDLDDIDGCDIELECGEEAWIGKKGPGSVTFYATSAEKGTFFEGTIELTSPFEPEKLTLRFDEVDGNDLLCNIAYDGEDLDNFGGDTTGKGCDFTLYYVDEDGETVSYQDGNDVDDDFDDGTPPMGPSPSDWEKSPKITEGNPTITGWYNCNYAHGSTWGSLYWNNEKNVWEDYYHGRVSATYETVTYYQGYNWDTSDWANQPPEPPAVRCKSCDWTGQRENLVEDEDYNDHCPECNGKKIDWIDYDPDTAKGRKNRKKYMQGV